MGNTNEEKRENLRAKLDKLRASDEKVAAAARLEKKPGKYAEEDVRAAFDNLFKTMKQRST